MRIEVTSKQKDSLGELHACEFGEDGGTIGRGLDNDWVLPDSDRYISSRHASIDFNKGSYYLIDTSSNGIYVNDSKTALGRRNPRRLFNGDRLRMGDFRMLVHIDKGESLVIPLTDEKPSVTPDQVNQLVPEETLRTGVELIGEEEVSGDKEFREALLGGDHQEVPVTKEVTKSANPLVEKKIQRQDRGNDKLLDAFAAGLGLNHEDLKGKAKPEELMKTAGELLREFISGAIELMGSRSALKGMFRLDQTTVFPQHNNPLKVSVDESEIAQRLLTGQVGSIGAKNAVREVTDDLHSHHDAILFAMHSAFMDYIESLDPDELQEHFDRTLNRGSILAATNKYKYWSLYRDFYPSMTRHEQGQFPQTFGDGFVRAYEKHVADGRTVKPKNGKAA